MTRAFTRSVRNVKNVVYSTKDAASVDGTGTHFERPKSSVKSNTSRFSEKFGVTAASTKTLD